MYCIRGIGALWARIGSLLLLACIFESCGYRYTEGGRLSGYGTISIPYVENDSEGLLTAALVREISSDSSLRYCRYGGGLSLKVCLSSVRQYNVGFEYDRDDAGERTRRIVPNEGRLLAIARVEVVECASGCVVMGPQCITASVDFDYDPLSTENELAVFSLGQFTQIDLAEDTAIHPLYRHLAKKIVQYVTTGW